MIINEILSILKNDEALNNILKPTDKRPKIYYGGTDKVEDCIVSELLPVSDDTIKEVNRLELTIITKQAVTGLSILDRVKELLLTTGDTAVSNTILNISLNGGGCLENLLLGTTHRKAYFNVVSRKGV